MRWYAFSFKEIIIFEKLQVMNYKEIKKLKRRYFKDGYLLEWREVVPVYKRIIIMLLIISPFIIVWIFL